MKGNQSKLTKVGIILTALAFFGVGCGSDQMARKASNSIVTPTPTQETGAIGGSTNPSGDQTITPVGDTPDSSATTGDSGEQGTSSNAGPSSGSTGNAQAQCTKEGDACTWQIGKEECCSGFQCDLFSKTCRNPWKPITIAPGAVLPNGNPFGNGYAVPDGSVQDGNDCIADANCHTGSTCTRVTSSAPFGKCTPPPSNGSASNAAECGTGQGQLPCPYILSVQATSLDTVSVTFNLPMNFNVLKDSSIAVYYAGKLNGMDAYWDSSVNMTRIPGKFVFDDGTTYSETVKVVIDPSPMPWVLKLGFLPNVPFVVKVWGMDDPTHKDQAVQDAIGVHLQKTFTQDLTCGAPGDPSHPQCPNRLPTGTSCTNDDDCQSYNCTQHYVCGL